MRFPSHLHGRSLKAGLTGGVFLFLFQIYDRDNFTEFLAVYSIEINTSATYVKVKSYFTDTAPNEISFFQVAYNESSSACYSFLTRAIDIDSVREFRRACLRFDSYLFARKDAEVSRFISQDTSKYFWWFICIDGSVRSFDSCDEGFFDLNIPDNRGGEELDLTGLPWDKIAEDLEDFTGLKFDDPAIKYGWIGGEECEYE